MPKFKIVKESLHLTVVMRTHDFSADPTGVTYKINGDLPPLETAWIMSFGPKWNFVRFTDGSRTHESDTEFDSPDEAVDGYVSYMNAL
jgi:hypothetical protein